MSNITEAEIAPWGSNWAWGLPLILLTVVIHVFGLGIINEGLVGFLNRPISRRSFIPLFATMVMAIGDRAPRIRGRSLEPPHALICR